MDVTSDLLSRAAIVGLGITETGKVYGRSAADFAADAVRLAVADAGLTLADVDGLVVSAGLSGGVDIRLARQLGLHDLGLLSFVAQAGSTAGAQVQLAAMAIAGGLATTVAIVHADAPLKPAVRSGDAYRRPPGQVATGFAGVAAVTGPRNATTGYALAARRHMLEYGTTSEQSGPSPSPSGSGRAQPAGPVPRADQPGRRPVVPWSRPVAPARLLLVCNGGIAIMITSAERAATCRSRRCTSWAGRRRTRLPATNGARLQAGDRRRDRPTRP